MNISVAGTGYVGMSIATLLAQHNHVTAVDVIPEKVEKINNKISPIQDDYIEKYLAEKELDLTATLDGAAAYKDADFVVIAAPTNYDPQKNFFDTHHIEDVIDLVLSVNPDAVMVIKSTIPVGYCRSLYVKYALKFLTDPALKGKKFNLLFSPEFLRESKALYDNLYPSRIIVGYPKILPAERNKKWDEENAAITAIGNPEAEAKAKTFASLLRRRPRSIKGFTRCGSKLSILNSQFSIRERYPLSPHGYDGSRSSQIVRQHLSCPACQLLQRARYLCRGQGSRLPGHHFWCRPRPPYRHPL